MSAKPRYPIAQSMRKLCAILKISPERVMRRAGLPADYLAHERGGVDAQQFFDLWRAAIAEAKRPDMPLFLGKASARGPFISAVFAFSCSPNIDVGLSRLALFKPLVGPIKLSVERAADSLTVSFGSTDPAVPMPDSMAAFEAVYLLELARIFTCEPIVPLAVELAGQHDCAAVLDEHFGVSALTSRRSALVLSLEDAHRPLISENDELWAYFEESLQRQLRERDQTAAMSERVRGALLEMLPSGQASAEAVCERLRLSKRSLQRRLREEGKSFQGVLDATRSELSLHYLSGDELSVEEISYLLAYRDPNSFYRAFHAWTGMTPMQARGLRSH